MVEQYELFELDNENEQSTDVILESPASIRKSKRHKSEIQLSSTLNETDSDVCLEEHEDEEKEMNNDMSELQNDQDNPAKNKSKVNRKSWPAVKKLEIIAYAEQTSNRQAARHFEINESTVRNFRKHKTQIEVMNPKQSTNRHGTVYWPKLEESLKEWVNSLPKKPKILQIQTKAIELAKSYGYEKFSGSTSYIFKFMQRNGIDSSSPKPRKLSMRTLLEPVE